MRARIPGILSIALLGTVGQAAAAPAPAPPPVARPARAASDHVPLAMRWLDINNFRCPITNYAFIGKNDIDNRAGGEWPAGSGEEYLFGSGILIAGTVDQEPFTETLDARTAYSFRPSSTNPLGWQDLGATESGAGSRAILTDPRAAIGYNPSGRVSEMSPLTKVFVSAEPDWPLGVPTSVLDTYTEYDDQDPTRWNTGEGSNSGADTGEWSGTPDNTTVATYGLGVKVKQTTYSWNYAGNSDIHFIVFDVENIRADGRAINNCFVGMVADPDIGSNASDDMTGFDATRNLGYAYDSDFSEVGFRRVPGFLGYRFLKSPVADHDIDRNGDGVIDGNSVMINGVPVKDVHAGEQIGLHAFKSFNQASGDPDTEWEWYMAMAGHNFREDQAQIYQPFDFSNTPNDQRFLQSTGPFTLQPGQPVRIVVAVMVAKAAGNQGDPIEVRVAELLRTSDVAQSIFDNNFVLPRPPVAPRLTARAGDGRIYLSWDTAAETTPDPFYAVASNPASTLYDPRYRQYDFEGYRVWRSSTGNPNDWQLLADYDVVSAIPRDAVISLQAGTYGGTLIYDAATTEGYFLSRGGTDLFNGHEYLVMVEGGTQRVKVYDVSLGGQELPCNTSADGADWWFYVGDNSRFELFDGNLNPLSSDPERNANGTYDRYVPGMVMYLGGMALRFADVPAPAGTAIWRVVSSKEENFGGNTSVAHSYIDGGLRNGQLYHYAVTAYDFQLSSPSSLESAKSLSMISISPRHDPSDTTRVTTALHTSGAADCAVNVQVVDPMALTGHKYQIGFNPDGTWFVRDTNLPAGQDIVINNQTNLSGDLNYPIVDGVLVNVIAPPVGIKSTSYSPSENKWFVERSAGYEALTGQEWGWGTTVTAKDYARVEIRFNGGSTLAPVYLRGGTPNYAYVGAGTIPAEIWDVTNNRRLAAAFVEQNGAVSRDGNWMPATAADGGREYLFVLAQPYNPDTLSADWDFFRSKSILADASQFPLMTGSWIIAKEGMAPATGDVWAISPYLGNTPEDVFEYTTTHAPVASSLELPILAAGRREVVTFPVRGTLWNARSAQMMFLVGANTVQSVSIVHHAFQGQQGAQAVAALVGDTVRVAMSGEEEVSLSNQALVVLSMTIRADADTGITHLVWLPAPLTSVDEEGVNLVNGELYISFIRYGDVTADGSLTAQDATWILQSVVGIRTGVDVETADVSDNGSITAYDAALVLFKVIHPEYVFPVRGGPLIKPSARAPVSLVWERTDAGWSLVVEDASGILAGDVALALPDEAQVQVAADGAFAYRQDHRTLYVSFVHSAGDHRILFTVLTSAMETPALTAASLNEGAILLKFAQPAAFALLQNAPNPFNPSTTIRFTLPEAGHVTLAVYDINGRLVRTLVGFAASAAQAFPPGHHEVVWDGRDNNGREVASGVYVYRLTAKQGVVTRRMVLAR